MKQIKIKGEYIKLGQFLKYTNVINNGSDAKIFIEENEIFVNNELENRRGRKLYIGDVIKIEGDNYEII